jgi:hypothetical protein
MAIDRGSDDYEQVCQKIRGQRSSKTLTSYGFNRSKIVILEGGRVM